MKLSIGENIKRLRNEKNITQEEFSKFIGVSFQTVSKWENENFYPDIELLPSIASYFEISVDDLMGCNKVLSEKKIDDYIKKFHSLINESEAVMLMKNAYTEFPKDWRIIDSYIWAMVEDKKHLNKNINEIRRLCRKTLNECTDQRFRDNALSNMIRICDDSETEEWYGKASGDLKATFKLERYRYREQWDLYNKQNDLIQYHYLLGFLLNLRPMNCSANQSIKCQKVGLKIIEVIFGDKCDGILHVRSYIKTRLAAALFGNGEKDEGYKVLEEAVNDWLKWFDIPEDKVLSLDSNIFETWQEVKSFPFAYPPEHVYPMFNKVDGWEWFNPVRDEERYKALKEKIHVRCVSNSAK
jgi:transcriptional regulator with XRE-family HTH domain